jgi:hypothetical protein
MVRDSRAAMAELLNRSEETEHGDFRSSIAPLAESVEKCIREPRSLILPHAAFLFHRAWPNPPRSQLSARTENQRHTATCFHCVPKCIVKVSSSRIPINNSSGTSVLSMDDCLPPSHPANCGTVPRIGPVRYLFALPIFESQAKAPSRCVRSPVKIHPTPYLSCAIYRAPTHLVLLPAANVFADLFLSHTAICGLQEPKPRSIEESRAGRFLQRLSPAAQWFRDPPRGACGKSPPP